MPVISAFRGLRYDLGHVGSLQDVLSPVPDEISVELRTELYRRHPANVVRLISNREEPGDVAGASDERVGRFFRNWQREGVLRREPDPAIYLYHHEFEVSGARHTRKGFFCRTQFEPHGDVHSPKPGAKPTTDARVQLLQRSEANLIPVSALYADPDEVLIQKLDNHVVGCTPVEAACGSDIHRIWPVTDIHVINEVSTQISSKMFLIVDGHDQYNAAMQYRAAVAGDDFNPALACNHVMMICIGQHDMGMPESLIPFFYDEDVTSNPQALADSLDLESRWTPGPMCGLVMYPLSN